MPPLRPSARSPGFTLIEVILALAVSAVVLLAIQPVFFGALRLRNATDRRLGDDLALQHTLDLVAADLRGLMLPGGTLAGEFQTDLSLGLNSFSDGTPVGPEFATSSARIDATTPFSEVQRVSYKLLPATDGSPGQTLVRSVNRNLLTYSTEEPVDTPVLDRVNSAGFEYFDGTDWTDSWDSSATGTLPSAVRFWLQREPAEGDATPAPVEIVVPVLVTTAASAATAAGESTTP